MSMAGYILGLGDRHLGNLILGDAENATEMPEELNAKALQVIDRVKSKLRGRDFNSIRQLSVEAQVDRLILQATSHKIFI